MAEQTDRDWVAELTGDDVVVREEAVARLRKYLVRGLKSAYAGRGADDAFCEDIAQDAVLRILDRIDQFEGRSKFTTWAMAVAVRLAVSAFRRRHFRDVSLEGLAGDGAMRIELPDREASPETSGLKSELMRALENAISQLSEKQRLATRALLDGVPVDVIAEKTGNNRNAVYKLVHDARKSLRRGLEESGYQWPDVHRALAGGV